MSQSELTAKASKRHRARENMRLVQRAGKRPQNKMQQQAYSRVFPIFRIGNL